MENNYRGTCEFELVILLGIHTRRSRLICHRWATEKTGKVGGLWGMRDRMEQTAWKTFLLSRSSYDWKNHRGKVCKIRARLTHTELCILSAQCGWHNQTLSLPPPEIKITDFTDHTVRGPFCRSEADRLLLWFNYYTRNLSFPLSGRCIFSTHLSACFPSLKKSSIPWTAINRFSGCCGEELKISIVPRQVCALICVSHSRLASALKNLHCKKLNSWENVRK